MEQGQEDQEDWNIDYFGKTAKGRGKSEGVGKGMQGKGAGRFKGKCYWCEQQGHRSSECSKKSNTPQKQRQDHHSSEERPRATRLTSGRNRHGNIRCTCLGRCRGKQERRKQEHDEQHHDGASVRTDSSNHVATLRRYHGELEGGNATKHTSKADRQLQEIVTGARRQSQRS